jgi:hypothetical protein
MRVGSDTFCDPFIQNTLWVSIGFPCNIYGKVLEESQRNLILLKGKDPACCGETL